MSDAPNQDLPNSRLNALVDELRAKISEIKAVVQPALEAAAEAIQTRAQELSDAIDAKIEEIADAVADRPGRSEDAPGQNK